MTIKANNYAKLKNGYQIGYAELGDPGGKPVFHFHGLPSSRLECVHEYFDQIACKLHARVINLDRPGIGISEYMPYTITSWPDMVSDAEDALNIDRFAAMGLSSGGKFVAACAWKIPDRLTTANIISGTCPLDLPGAMETLTQQDQQTYWVAEKMPWLFRLMLKKIAGDVQKDPKSMLSLFPEISEVDKKTLARPDVSNTVGKASIEAFNKGTRGAAMDWMLEAKPWGFSLQDIQMPVNIWHGDDDKLLSKEQSCIMAKGIAKSNLQIRPNEGHFSLFTDHFEEILTQAVA